MSTSAVDHPRTTARTAALVAVVGVVALSVHEPFVALGAATGGALAVALVTASSGDRFVLPATLLPVGIFGIFGTLSVAVTTRFGALVLTLLALVLGIGTATLIVGDSIEHPVILERIAFQGLLASGCGFFLSILFATSEGQATIVERVLFLGPAAFSLAALALVAGLTVAVAVLAVPSAMFPLTSNVDEDRAEAAKQKLAVRLTALALVVALLVGVVVSIAPVPDWVVGGIGLRLLFVALAGAGVVFSAIGGYARWSWYSPAAGRDPAALLSLGTVSGFGVAIGVIAAIGGPPIPGGWLSLFGLLVPAFGLGWVVLGRYASLAKRGSAPAPATVTALTLCVSGVVVAATIPSDAPTGTGRAGLVAVGAIGAGLFVYRAGRFGRRLGTEVGGAAATSRPQLVRLGWLGALTALGVVIAVAGLWSGTVLAPTLSVPATAGTLAGCVALVAGIWLLLDKE
jgi:hypothetical protein